MAERRAAATTAQATSIDTEWSGPFQDEVESASGRPVYGFKLHDQPAISIPKHRRHPHIHTGYRFHGSGWGTATWTLFGLHNETFNVWTHLIGACYFAAIAPQNYADVIWGDDSVDSFMFSSYVTCAALCMLFSTMFHLFSCLSDEAYIRLLRLDMSGICLLIGSSFAVGINNGFKCSSALQFFYLFVSIGGLVVSLALINIDRFQGPSWDPIRMFAIVGVVAFGVVPAIHWAFSANPAIFAEFLPHLLGMFGFYALGFVFYYWKIPECFAPGKFDVFLHSHQWWHVCVFLASVTWLRGMWTWWRMRHELGDSCDMSVSQQ